MPKGTPYIKDKKFKQWLKENGYDSSFLLLATPAYIKYVHTKYRGESINAKFPDDYNVPKKNQKYRLEFTDIKGNDKEMYFDHRQKAEFEMQQLRHYAPGSHPVLLKIFQPRHFKAKYKASSRRATRRAKRSSRMGEVY